jgi:hypothetical protein
VLALALMLPAAGLAQTPNAPAAGGKRPIIEIPVMTFAFGDIYHQDQYIHAFVIKNRGTADLTIEDVKPG